MENEIVPTGKNLQPYEQDNNALDILQIANRAEETKDAFKKIMAVSLAVTTISDWVDMQGKPYLEVSGSEKIANLFGISWNFNKPDCETEHDGHYTFTYTGIFKLGSRSITVEGSRSSRDRFFKQNDYTKDYTMVDNKKVYPAKPLLERDNKRDVRMAAMTNMIGNGITRILGLRGITYAMLKEYTNITQKDIENVKFDGNSGKTKKDYGKNAEGAKTNSDKISTAQVSYMDNLCKELDMANDTILNYINNVLGITDDKNKITTINNLTPHQASTAIGKLKADVKAMKEMSK